ncbi:hypothetical protein CONPUDRAFT_73874 [Coniophora puteana RWD-64-598 SS2]|uniref:Uncharacterized protein n=1 Tax=Coniophora puteana (strain RWD-64-598) TaxID=741705 RepID=A0A5M3MP93_CONPW|nr:uncharacterized protein CONPUDRAFT_73874 [Coniophora puteana RWD-64-598 SS2]EIW80860.1 hypothetical protein CONPUDRAFT_73874 [Coniophora puteana RWD-64-598 SS2]
MLHRAIDRVGILPSEAYSIGVFSALSNLIIPFLYCYSFASPMPVGRDTRFIPPSSFPNVGSTDNVVIPSQIMDFPTSEVLVVSPSVNICLAAAIYLFAREFVNVTGVDTSTIPADLTLDHVLANYVQHVHVMSCNGQDLTGTFPFIGAEGCAAHVINAAWFVRMLISFVTVSLVFAQAFVRRQISQFVKTGIKVGVFLRLSLLCAPSFLGLNSLLDILRVQRLKSESLATLGMTAMHPLLALLNWSHTGYTKADDAVHHTFPPQLLDDIPVHEAIGRSHEHWQPYSDFMGKLLKEPAVHPSPLPDVNSFPFLTIWSDPLLLGHPTIHFYVGANGSQSLVLRLAAAVFLFTQENIYPLVAKDAPSSLSNTSFNHHLANYMLAINVTQHGETYMMGTFTCTDNFRTRSAEVFERCRSEGSTMAFQYKGCSVVSNTVFAHGICTGIEAYVQATVHAAWLHFVANGTQGK